MEATAAPSGTFSVSLAAIAWASRSDASAEDDSQPQQHALWAHVQVETSGGQPVDGVWFSADDENVMSKSVEMAALTETDGGCQLEYVQSSRPVVLSKDSLVALLNAQLKVSLFSGETRVCASDELWGETRIALMPVVIGERLQTSVCITNTSTRDAISLDVSIQSDSDLADFALCARVLRLHSIEITNPPKEWTITSANDEEALQACAAAERNAATYEMELQLPDFSGDSHELSLEVVKLAGGKLKYEPNSSSTSSSAAEDGSTSGLTGSWAIAFPAAVVNKLYLKPSIRRLIDFVQVEKRVPALVRRAGVESTARVTATLTVNLSAIAAPGQTRALVRVPLKQISPLPKESLEQELAGATSNDEKKRLQGLISDYEASFVQAATDLSGSIRTSKTRVECVVEVLGNGPLVAEPPLTPAPTKTIEDLVTPRDLTDEYDQRKDVASDLRTEIRRAVLKVLEEYEDGESSSSREEKRQRVVFKLNSQGAYHEFKEKLKKRVVPLIRDQFADDMGSMDPSETAEGDEDLDAEALAHQQQSMAPPSRANAKKKAYFAKLYATLMEEVQRVLHETFYASSSSTLEATHKNVQPRDDAAVTRTLTTLGLKALENEVNGDAEKSEAFHRDCIAFAEARAMELPQTPLHPSLAAVWFDYGKFCLGQGELDKAGGALRQCLSLEPHSVEALTAHGGLLCELQDFTSADVVVKNAVQDALGQLTKPGQDEADGLHQVVTAHSLLALFYSMSGQDETGNLVLFELLKAQRLLHRLYELESHGDRSSSHESTPSLSAVWIHLAEALHTLRLRAVTQVALQLAETYHYARDVLTREARVLKRVILAEVLSLRGEGDRATELLQDALEVDRTHPFAWLVLGNTYLQLESQTQAAIECLQHSLEAKHRLRVDQRLALFVHLGLVLLQCSQFPMARATFLTACEEFSIASTWLGVGIASLRLEDWDAAQIALAEANRLDTTNPEVWGYMALLALSASPRVTPQVEQRAKHYATQALRLQLANPVLLRELSSGFVAIDRLEDAERLLRRSLVFQDSSLTRKTLADILAAQNCAEDALAQYKQSLEASRDLSQRGELLEKCAELLVTLGRPEEAVECRQMASQLQVAPIKDVDGPTADVRDAEVVGNNSSD